LEAALALALTFWENCYVDERNAAVDLSATYALSIQHFAPTVVYTTNEVNPFRYSTEYTHRLLMNSNSIR